MRRLLAGIAASVVLASATTGCGSSTTDDTAKSGGRTSVKVGVIPIIDVAPIYLGKEKGFFSKQGIDLTLESGQGGAAIVPGVVSGQFQFGFSNVTSLMLAQSKGVPLKGVANGVNSTDKQGADFGALVVKKDSPIKSAKDLAGKKVSVNTLKNIGDTTTRESVRKAGGDPGSVKFVELAFPQMPAALEAGQIDAAWVVEPTLSLIKSKGGRVIASPFVDTSPVLTVALYFTSTKLAQQNPGLVKKFQTAMNESLKYADTHPDEVRQILTTYTKIDAATAKSLILPTWPQKPNRASLAILAKLAEKDGLFDTAPDLDRLLP